MKNIKLFYTTIVIVALAIIGIGIFAWVQFREAHEISFERLTSPAPYYLPGLKERQGWIINSDKEWSNFWEILVKGLGPDLSKKPPVITDFSIKTLLVVSAGEKSTGGFLIEIVRIVAGDGKLIVFAKEIQPGEGCAVTQAFTTPMNFAVVSKTSLPVEFQFQEIQDKPCR